MRREVFDVENYGEHTPTSAQCNFHIYSIENERLNIYRKFYKSKLCAGERVDAQKFCHRCWSAQEIQLHTQKQNNNGNLRKVLRFCF